FDCNAVDRIRPIEHNDLHVTLLARAHAEIERPNESVVSRADVLKIDHQGVEIGEHLRSRLTMLAIQTVNRNVQVRMFVTFPFDHIVLGLAEKPVLRTEEGAELKQITPKALQNFRSVLERRRNGTRMK